MLFHARRFGPSLYLADRPVVSFYGFPIQPVWAVARLSDSRELQVPPRTLHALVVIFHPEDIVFAEIAPGLYLDQF